MWHPPVHMTSVQLGAGTFVVSTQAVAWQQLEGTQWSSRVHASTASGAMKARSIVENAARLIRMAIEKQFELT